MDSTKKSPESEIKTLTALNKELENYFRNTIIPQLFVDSDMVLRKFTPPAMKQFQLSEDLLGKHIDEISHKIRFPTFLENIKEVIDTGEDLEKEIQTTDLRWFQMNILPYRVFEENKNNGVIITFVDITGRIRNLKELERLNADHETFIYSVSHDVKGPLSNLESLIETMKEITTDDNSESKHIIEMVGESVGDLRQLINELTDVSKTRNNYSIGPERVSIENIVEEVQLTLKDRILETKTKITLDIQVSEISFVRKNLRSIIYNLLSNSIKYKSKDRSPVILLKTEEADDFIVLIVSDNGLGIAAHHQKIIFSEFTRINEEVEGTGVGLYIVSKMVENSGGRIEVQSKEGEGTTFRIYFKTIK